jgi:hypothetical protein
MLLTLIVHKKYPRTSAQRIITIPSDRKNVLNFEGRRVIVDTKVSGYLQSLQNINIEKTKKKLNDDGDDDHDLPTKHTKKQVVSKFLLLFFQ